MIGVLDCQRHLDTAEHIYYFDSENRSINLHKRHISLLLLKMEHFTTPEPRDRSLYIFHVNIFIHLRVRACYHAR